MYTYCCHPLQERCWIDAGHKNNGNDLMMHNRWERPWLLYNQQYIFRPPRKGVKDATRNRGKGQCKQWELIGKSFYGIEERACITDDRWPLTAGWVNWPQGYRLVGGPFELFADLLSLWVDVEVCRFNHIARCIEFHVWLIRGAFKGLHLRLSQR